jgi:hypothetical protein
LGAARPTSLNNTEIWACFGAAAIRSTSYDDAPNGSSESPESGSIWGTGCSTCVSRAATRSNAIAIESLSVVTFSSFDAPLRLRRTVPAMNNAATSSTIAPPIHSMAWLRPAGAL